MLWLFPVAFGLMFVGGVTFLLSHVVGEIPRKWPFEPISRYDEPERFAFWQDVSGGALALGIVLLIALIIFRRLGWLA